MIPPRSRRPLLVRDRPAPLSNVPCHDPADVPQVNAISGTKVPQPLCYPETYSVVTVSLRTDRRGGFAGVEEPCPTHAIL